MGVNEITYMRMIRNISVRYNVKYSNVMNSVKFFTFLLSIYMAPDNLLKII